MGMPNSRRSRRRHRGKYRQFYATHVWMAGQWLVRTVHPVERIDLGDGRWAELHNENWNPPEALRLFKEREKLG